MSILSFPSVPIAQSHWRLVPLTQSFESELDGSSQDLALPGDRWAVQITVVDLMGREARLFSSFVNRLRGRAGRFYMTPPGCGTPLGTALGNGLVKGAGQTGTSLVIDGLTPNQAEYLLPGDYFQVGVELKQVVVTAVVDNTGQTTVQFTPPLRTSPADNAPIITTNPTCIMKQVDDNQSAHDLSGPRIYAFQQSYIEAIDP